MTQIEMLLKYQEEDAKLLKVEREVASSVERKNLAQAVNFVTKATERLDALEGKAGSLNNLLEQLQKEYAELAETLAEFENLDEMLAEGADISFYKRNITHITDSLKTIKQEVASLNKAIKESDEEFQTLYQKNRAMQKQGKEFQETYEKYKSEKRKESESIKAGLEKLAKDIDPDVMKRYQTKRNEHIFPVLCPVKSNRCTKCGYELSLVGKEKISAKGYVECENCHSILYTDGKQ